MRWLFLLSMWLISVIVLGGFELKAADSEAAAPNVDADHAAKRAKGLELFRNEIGGLLKQKCVDCHGGQTLESKLDLTTQDGLLKGGERGPAAVIGRGEKSLLVRAITHQQEPFMPKGDEKLSPAQIQSIVDWIDLGAVYDQPLAPKAVESTNWTEKKISPDAKQFWSYQPLAKTAPPDVTDDRRWSLSSIDPFILDKLISARLRPNPQVERHALIRRLSFDLLGLPPSVDEIDAFINDPRPDATERLVDRFLASPHYGERWGRRWLDLARFAESHGFEHDTDRASAFHYRDFVIQALNSGMPYDQFVQWQIAGDEIAPTDRLAMMATGFLAAGVHSTQITKNEVEKHRYDEMDDMLATVGTSMLGLTIGCARCHDHKFDAIPQADYYRLLSTFTTTVRSEVELDFDPEGYRQEKSQYDREHAPFEQAVREYESRELPGRFAEWRAARDASADDLAWLIPGGIEYKSQGKAMFAQQPDGSWLVGGPNPANDIWTITFQTRLTDIRSIRLEALADSSLVRSGPGRANNGNFALSDVRMTVRPMGEDKDQQAQSVALVGAKASFEQKEHPVNAAIDDDPKSAWAIDPEFGKNHVAVFWTAEPFGSERGTTVTINLKFNTNTQHAIGRARLSISRKSDPTPTTGEAMTEAIQTLLKRPMDELTAEQKSAVLDWYKPLDAGWKAVDDRRAAHAATAPKPRIQKVLVATEGLPAMKLHTQAEAEFMNETHFLRRGEPNQKVAVAQQGFLQVLMANPDAPQDFQSAPPPGWRTSYRRKALGHWLVDSKMGAGNLLGRVIVNRLWQSHLGRGIVTTPSDFGARGALPTHPELLDWLAAELLRHGWELKPLHRLIVASQTYQQSCTTDEPRLALDPENSLFWHRPRRRLEAEVIRDAILAVSDQLNDRMYGPGQLDESYRRRSLYFTVKRSQLIPSMVVFDAPDGGTPIADRPQTTIAPQALLLMNNPHVREASRQFADRLLPIAKRSSADAVRSGYVAAVSRDPTDAELAAAITFLDRQYDSYLSDDSDSRLRQAFVDFSQVLFCLNEFIYAD